MAGRLIISKHKSWHVWNQDNVDRVEKDERLLAEKKAEEEKRVRLAEGEARLALLRKRAQRMRGEEEEEGKEGDDQEMAVSSAAVREPLNLFEDGEIEQVLLGGARAVESGARERRLGAHNETESKSAAPKATEEEKFGAVEKHVPWYAGGKDSDAAAAAAVIEKKLKADRITKEREDPLFVMQIARDTNKQLHELHERGISLDQALVDVHSKKRQRKEEKKEKKKEKKKKSKEKTIEELRAERIERERVEHEKAKQLLKPMATFQQQKRSNTPARYNGGYFK